jgi:chromosomal replication initiation ATPase DnaA
MAGSASRRRKFDEAETAGTPVGGRVVLNPLAPDCLSRMQARRNERVFVACECVMDIAAAFFNVAPRELRTPGRGADDISRIRQIAMYAAHVVLSFTMAEVGRGFGRDRTTVMHACHTIEDLRDDDEFDGIVARLERVVAAAFRGRDGFPE